MMEETLLPVALEHLRFVWPDITERLGKLIERCGEAILPEDVYHEILIGNAYLFALPDRDGFVIVKLVGHTGGRDLFVWWAWNDSDPSAQVYLEQLKVLAGEQECTRIAWESDRRWERHLPEAKVRYSYTIDLEGG